MTAETLARWQFGITTVYHFFFVPITIALSLLVAVLQTLWVRTGNERYLRLTKLFGKLFLINFAMGVVTGIVQEFQFGMNWSEYSRFVGDIFGAPLALEALISFFLESVFLGMWIFGWDKLPKKVHLATIWLGSIGTLISSIFILIANSWMQNPVGAVYNPTTGRAEMSDFGAVLTNPVALVTWPHVIFGAFMTAGGILLGVAGWSLAKANKQLNGAEPDGQIAKDIDAHRFALKLGAWTLIVATCGSFFTGDIQGKIMVELQPIKMAATEAVSTTVQNAPFAVLAWPDGSGGVSTAIEVPGVLGLLAGTENGEVKGFNELMAAYQNGELVDPNNQLAQGAKDAGLLQQYSSQLAAAGYVPDILTTFYSFRIMIGLGFLALIVAIIALVKTGKGKLPKGGKGWTLAMVIAPLFPLFAGSFGWLVTEIGRQPWIVNGVLPTASAVSPGVTALEVGLSLVLYTVIYGVGAVVEVGLFLKTIKSGLPVVEEPQVSTDEDAPLSFAY
ncbi:MAG: cytochrome ubiquinol oxidase subunit I [Propionibacteriaceae bacterium]|jgi:cytochrome d ubiquinol oxidase subunit I|nr:cytochrome ubiquinol oxidase subunit I [Propionibacteriaceae bacterium]